MVLVHSSEAHRPLLIADLYPVGRGTQLSPVRYAVSRKLQSATRASPGARARIRTHVRISASFVYGAGDSCLASTLGSLQIQARHRDGRLRATTSGPSLHHHQRAKLVKAIRAETCSAAVDIPAFDGPVTVTARFQWGDNHRRDTSNLFPTFKAAVDGLTDAGVIPGDHDAIVRDTAIGVEMPPNPALKGYGRMVLEISELAQ